MTPEPRATVGRLPSSHDVPESSAFKQLSVEDSGLELDQLVAMLRRFPDATGIGVWQNLAMDSGMVGASHGMVFGPSNTYQALDSLPDAYPGNVPVHWAYRLRGYVPAEAVREALVQG